jgi:5-epi-alpha-selinene synthase
VSHGSTSSKASKEVDVAEAAVWFRAAQFATLTARTYPATNRLDLLVLATEWNVWLFAIDALCDEYDIGRFPDRLEQLFARCSAVVSTLPLERLQITEAAEGRDERVGEDGMDSVVASLADLWSGIQAASHATSRWSARFLRDLTAYFSASCWESAYRAMGTVPSLQDYLAYRPLSSGILTDIDLIEVILDESLPDAVRDHRALRHLQERAAQIMCWANDLLSLAKERAQGNCSNLVLVLAQDRGLSLHEAILEARRLHDQALAEFGELEQQVRGLVAHDPQAAAIIIDAYMTTLHAAMRAQVSWAEKTVRYRI